MVGGPSAAAVSGGVPPAGGALPEGVMPGMSAMPVAEAEGEGAPAAGEAVRGTSFIEQIGQFPGLSEW